MLGCPCGLKRTNDETLGRFLQGYREGDGQASSMVVLGNNRVLPVDELDIQSAHCGVEPHLNCLVVWLIHLIKIGVIHPVDGAQLLKDGYCVFPVIVKVLICDELILEAFL